MSFEERTTESVMLEDLKELYEEAYDVEELSEKSLNKFHEISEKLSRALPKLSDSNSLFEIDDLLYQENELSYVTTSTVPLEEANSILSNHCLECYLVLYLELQDWKSLPKYYRLAVTFLQIINEVQYEILTKNCGWHIITYVKKLMSSRITNKVCLALKVLNISFKNTNLLESGNESNTFDCLYLWIKRLQQIPQARHPRQQRIHSWMSRQATAFIERLKQISYDEAHIRNKYYRKEYEIYAEHFNSNCVQEMTEQFHANGITKMANVGCHYSFCFAIDHLHTFFMSAINEDERTKRLTSFLQGVSGKYTVAMSRTRYYTFDPLKCILEKYHTLFGDLLEDPDEQTKLADDILRKMERKYGLEIKPYLSLSNNNNHEVDEEEPKVDLTDEIINKSINSDDDNDEIDDTTEKFLFYDDFMKQLQVLDIIHIAFTMNQEILKITNNIGYDTDVFRPYYSPIRTYLKKAFLNPQRRGYVPWVIELLLRKCPYMILPKRYEYLKEDLVKMLKGEEIDEFAEEDLYYIINSLRDDDIEDDTESIDNVDDDSDDDIANNDSDSEND